MKSLSNAATLLLLLLTNREVTAQPYEFTDQHLDISIEYEPGEDHPLSLGLHDEDQDLEVPPEDAILVVSEEAKVALPPGFEVLGEEGSWLWILPQVQTTGLLHLGIGAKELPAGVFTGPAEVRLTAVEGPGYFIAWQAAAPGDLVVRYNSRDGITSEDAISLAAGSHAHLNFGFSSNGIYRISLQVSARTNDGEVLLSEPATFAFHIAPLPPTQSSRFREWQQHHWPGSSDPAVIGPAADPDGDRQSNLWEYAVGSDPNVPNELPSNVLRIHRPEPDNSVQPRVTFNAAISAEDLDFSLWSSDDAGGGWSQLEAQVTSASEPDGRAIITLIDPRPMDFRASAFYRLGIRLRDTP